MDEVERLIAIEEIKHLKARYFRCMDTKDWDGLAGVFAPDAVMDMSGETGGDDGVVRGRAEIVEFVRGAKVLIHDTMYTVEEYDHHRGWGHSTYHEAVELALDAGVETLVLFHHKPERTDDEVDRRVAECREHAARRGTLQVVAAAEGLSLTV